MIQFRTRGSQTRALFAVLLLGLGLTWSAGDAAPGESPQTADNTSPGAPILNTYAASAPAGGGGYIMSVLVRSRGGSVPPTGTPAPTATQTNTATPTRSATPAATASATATPGSTRAATPTATRTSTPLARVAVLAAAGDIADCDSDGDELTARLLTDRSWTIATLGDTVYESGTPREFADCYEPSWGAYKDRTRPAVGNHDYKTPGASGYFGYFGSAAGDPDKGYYSYDLESWHIVVLNSNCSRVGGCEADSAQAAWLKRDLASHPARCTLAYWHHPMYGSTGSFTDYVSMRALWQMLYDAGAEVVLAGHAHNYERMAPMNADGAVDASRGLRSFVVGTGGSSHQSFESVHRHSVVRESRTYGVLKLTLRGDRYDWKFLPEPGETFTDEGTGFCH